MSLSLGFLNFKVLFCLCVTLFQLHFTFSASNSSGFTLRAFVDDSPGSPLYLIENLTKAERIERLIKITNARAEYLDLLSNRNASVVLPDNIPVPVFRERNFYAVQFALGSQNHKVKLLMDTGSGLTWTQCLPCTTCFEQRLPIFNPSASSTYASLPCDHPICQGGDFTCENNVCRYTVVYGGGSSTKGIGSMETVHFSTSDQSQVQSYPFVFGCSIDSKNMYFQRSDISGIFGLDLSEESITQQLSTTVGNIFSYCLAPFDNALPRPLALRFGEDVPRLPRVQSTLYMASAYNKFYNLELLDITVANIRLEFPPDTFRERGPGRGGCFIDSGALFSQIDGRTIGVNAFERVLRVFEAYYGSRGLRKRTTQSPTGFELCYDRPSPLYADFATLTFHFNGADYHVDGKYTRVLLRDHFCVAILRGQFASILGAWQQQNKRIIHNGMSGALQFADEKCIDDNIE